MDKAVFYGPRTQPCQHKADAKKIQKMQKNLARGTGPTKHRPKKKKLGHTYTEMWQQCTQIRTGL